MHDCNAYEAPDGVAPLAAPWHVLRMAFQPGNKYGELQRGVPKPQHQEKRKFTRSLAMAIRERLHPDSIFDWLFSVWQGRDPLTGETVPLEMRDRALKTLLDRGWGQAAQMLIVEGQITTEHISNAPASNRPNMTLEQIQARRAALIAALEPVDAECTESKP